MRFRNYYFSPLKVVFSTKESKSPFSKEEFSPSRLYFLRKSALLRTELPINIKIANFSCKKKTSLL